MLRSRLLKNIGLYAIGNALNGAIPFLLLPVLTVHLSQEELGILGNLELLIALFIPIVALNTGSALGRHFFDLEREAYQKLVFNFSLLLMLIGALALCMLSLFGPFFSFHFEVPENVLWTVGVIAISKQLLEARLTIYRVLQKPVGFGVLRILSTGADLILSVILVVQVYNSWEGRIYGQLAAYAFFAFISLFLLFKNNWMKVEVSKNSIRQLLQFGVPLIPHAVGGMLLTFGDRWVITKELGIEQAGIYFVGYQVGMLMSIIQNSFNQAWSPWFYQQLTTPSKSIKLKIVKATYVYGGGLFVICGLAYLCVPFLFQLFIGEDFQDAQQFVGWVLLGYTFSGIYKMMVNYLLFLKRTKTIGAVTLVVAAMNIILNFLLIPAFGIEGAAMATAASFLLQLFIVGGIAAKAYPMPWGLSESED